MKKHGLRLQLLRLATASMIFISIGGLLFGVALEEQVTADDAALLDQFGNSVAISGETAIVGAYADDDDGDGSGSAYIFVKNGDNWIQQAKLTANDAADSDLFGVSVAISGDTAIVGAHGDDDSGQHSGSAYVFVRDGTVWTQQIKLTAEDGAASDDFGISVAISGDTAVVGANGTDDSGSDSGSAYIFVRSVTAWTLQTELIANDGAAYDKFGTSVAISGDTVVVGAFGDDDGGENTGSAYIFVRSGTSWTQQDKLTASDGAAYDTFGSSVAISGDTVIAGAGGDDDSGESSGSAYIFIRNANSWSEQDKLTANDTIAGDNFGISVSISGDIALVGAHQHNGSGSAYAFIRSGSVWTQNDKIVTDDGEESDNFGKSVSISNTHAVIGAYGDNGYTGSGYIYSMTAPGINIEDHTRVLEVNTINYSIPFTLSDIDTPLDNLTVEGRSDNQTILQDSAINFTGNGAERNMIFTPETDAEGTVSITLSVSDESNTASKSLLIIINGSKTAKFIAPDREVDDGFGISVDVSGNTAIIGADRDDDNGVDSGSAYIFIYNGTTWVQQAKLTANDGASYDLFGTSVAISGDTAVVGAYGDDDNGTYSGSAYIFVRNGNSWSQQDKLTANDASANTNFGISVGISGDIAVIGADVSDNSGSIYTFVRNGTYWSQQQKIKADDYSDLDRFGHSVDISGTTIIAGAYEDSTSGSSSGSVYIFVLNNIIWAQQTKLTAPDGAADDEFGRRVAISGDIALVRASGDDDNGSDSGSAYIFERDGTSWAYQTKLTADDGKAGDQFGNSVAISGDTAVIGANQNDESGSAYVFVKNDTTWSQQLKLNSSDAKAGDQFGISSAIYNDTVIIGAYRDDDSGSAYMFNLAPRHDVSATVIGGNGTIPPLYSVVDKGVITLTATPDPDYEVKKWYIDNIFYQSGDAELTIENITKDILVEVEFQRGPVTVEFTITGGGAIYDDLGISPLTYTIPYGKGLLNVTAVADQNHLFLGYKGDYISQNDSLTITSFYSDMSIEVVFDLDSNDNGLPDDWEAVVNPTGNPFYSYGDEDDDGLTNIEEFLNDSGPFEFNIEMHLGWNLVHVPRTGINMSSLFTKKIGDIWIWSALDGVYEKVTELEIGKAVWVFWNGPHEVLVPGGTPLTSQEISLLTGWNLIGTIFKTSFFDDISIKNKISVIYFWDAEHNYYQLNKNSPLKPGVGYWFYCTEPATVNLSE